MNKNVIRKKHFITPVQCDGLNTWVNQAIQNRWLDSGIDSVGMCKNRLTTRLYGNRFEYPQIVHSVFDQITEALALHNLSKSVAGGGRDGVVVSCTYRGGDVYQHTDPMEDECHVLRCNVITQGADSGAKLYIDNEHIDVEVGELHCYLPSALPHYVTAVQGQTPRIMWMFGYKCDKERFDQLLAVEA
jgi:hypothetical protein